MKPDAIGLDIGGANIKAATSSGEALSQRFEVWKHPERLSEALRDVSKQLGEADRIAVTMTGELCDCFHTKREGVKRILASVAEVFPEERVRVWSTAGRFVTIAQANADHMAVAAANWHAQATFVGKMERDDAVGQVFNLSHGNERDGKESLSQPVFVGQVKNLSHENAAILVDCGSTTTDIIPIINGVPRSIGLTDPERLKSSELLYTGSRRTPMCSITQTKVAAELFATALDAYLLLDRIPEDPDDRETADGRPATKEFAHARLTRMLGGDAEIIPLKETLELAGRAFEIQREMIADAMRVVRSRLPAPLMKIFVSGSGEFLARAGAEQFYDSVVSLSERWGTRLSTAACAYSLAMLAQVMLR